MTFNGEVYTSYDGQEFDTEAECLAHEELSRAIEAAEAEMSGDVHAWMAEGLSFEEAWRAAGGLIFTDEELGIRAAQARAK